TSTITATVGSITGSTVLTVTPATLQSIAVTPANPSISKGATQQFTATGTFSDNSTQVLNNAVWSSGTVSVATINATGLATALATGTSTITATVGSITGSTVLTVIGGTPRIAGSVVGQGLQSPGVLFVDIQLKDTGTSSAVNLNVSTVTLRTVSGTGTVVYDSMSPTLPLSVGNLAIGAAKTIRCYFDVPASVTRFTVSEQGTVQDGARNTYTYSTTEVVTP